MAVLTPFIDALKLQLATDLGIAFKRGYIRGPVEDKDLGCVYPASTNPWDQAISVEQLHVSVTVFQRYVNRTDPQEPVPTTRLEALADLLKASVKANQTGEGPWYQQLGEVRFDMTSQSFDASILGWDANPASAGA